MSSPHDQNESSSPNCEACQIEVAQKRLALQQEKLEVDKQILRAEKKALRQRLPKEHERTETVWKQVSHKQEQELEHCKARIKDLEATLQEKEWASRRTQRYRELQNQVEDLQAQLQKKHDDHEGVVGELKIKMLEQEKEGKLAMEVAVRRTETEWKLKVDELQVELEKLQAKYEQQGEHVEQLETHIMNVQIQLEASEEVRAKKREQLEELDYE